MHLLYLHKEFCKASQIYTTNLQNQCLVYNIPQYECQNSIYYPRENYNRYLSALNLPIKRDQECFTNQCIIEVTKRPLQIYLKYNPLIGGMSSGINLNSISNQNLISNVSGLNQSLINPNPNTVVKNVYVTKTIDTSDSSEHDSPPPGKNKKRKKIKQESSSSCEEKPKKKKKVVKDSCSKSDCDNETKDKKVEPHTVTRTEKVTKTVFSPQPDDIKTIDVAKPDIPEKPDTVPKEQPEIKTKEEPEIKTKEQPSNVIKTITKTIQPKEQETVIISVSPPIPEVKTITLPPVTKTIEKPKTKHKEESDEEELSSDLESTESKKKTVTKRRIKKYKKKQHKEVVSEDVSCPEPIIKTVTVTKNDPVPPQKIENLPPPPVQFPIYDPPSQPPTKNIPQIPTNVTPEILHPISDPETPPALEPVTLIKYETQTVTNEVPLTLYREFTTTIEKEKPVINYSVLTITENETVFKTKTITDIPKEEPEYNDSVPKTVSTDYRRSLNNIKWKLKIPKVPVKHNRSEEIESTPTSEIIDKTSPKTVYIKEECSTAESEKEEKKVIKKRKKKEQKSEEEKEHDPDIKDETPDPKQIDVLKPFISKLLEQLSFQKVKEKEVAEIKPEPSKTKENKETKTINLPPQTIINHYSPRQESTKRIIALRKIGSIPCISECLIPETNECRPDCEPQYMNNNSTGQIKNKKVRTVINTIYKKTSTNSLKTVS